MKNSCKYTALKMMGLFLIAFGLPSTSWAVFSIGEAAENLMAPTEMLTKLLLVSCYIIGIALILGSIVQYKIHRQSPKLVPLTTPITLLILGLISVMIPYGTKMFGPTYSAEGQSNTYKKQNILPLPDTTKGPTLLPLPPMQRSAPPPPPPQQNDMSSQMPQYNAPPQYSAPPPPPPPSHYRRDKVPSHVPSSNSGGGHWTDDPRYNR